MVGKKPAKANSGNSVKQVERPGKPTLYIAGFKSSGNICPKCGKQTKKGIVYEHQNILYCSRGCVIAA